MTYFFALMMAGLGGLFFLLANQSKDNLIELRQLAKDKDNRCQGEGHLEIINIRNSRNFFECDTRLTFKNQNGKEWVYTETHFGSSSKASFLRDAHKKGEIPVQVIYDKRDPYLHYIKELKPIETNQNSVVGFRIMGGLFILLALIIFGEAMGWIEKLL